MSEPAIEIRFAQPMPKIPEAHRREAERKAQEAFVMALLRQGDISAGRASELLEIDREELAKLMFAHKISPFDDSMTAEDLRREVDRAERLLDQRP